VCGETVGFVVGKVIDIFGKSHEVFCGVWLLIGDELGKEVEVKVRLKSSGNVGKSEGSNVDGLEVGGFVLIGNSVGRLEEGEIEGERVRLRLGYGVGTLLGILSSTLSSASSEADLSSSTPGPGGVI
jgi:hypothetical protein